MRNGCLQKTVSVSARQEARKHRQPHSHTKPPKHRASSMRARAGGSGETNKAVAEALRELLDFLEVCVHQLLHTRAVYPKAIFDRRRKYGLPVFMSRHPDLNLYIREVLDAAAPLLQEGSIDQLVVCIYGSEGEPLESFGFQIPHSAALLHRLADVPPSASVAAQPSSSSAAAAVGLPRTAMDPYPAFRRVLLRLVVCDQQAELGPVPEDATFALLLSTRRPTVVTSGGGGGGGGGKANKLPGAWAAAVASGEFTLSSLPQECYLTTTTTTTTTTTSNGQQQQQQQQQQQEVGQMNVVNWAGGGGGGGGEQWMGVWLRSKLLAGAGGQGGGGGGGGQEEGEGVGEDEFQ